MRYSHKVNCPQCLREMEAEEMYDAGLYSDYSEDEIDVTCYQCFYSFKVHRFPVLCYEVIEG